MYLKVSPIKGVMQCYRKAELSSQYVGPYKILEQICKMTYSLALPSKMTMVHSVFYMSMLRKFELYCIFEEC